MKYLILLILFCSCMTEKKAVKKLALINAKHPIVVAKACSEKFPNKESIEVRETITHDTLYSIDTFYKYTIINGDTIRIAVPYPVQKTIIKTIQKDSIVRVENTAKVFVLEKQLNSCNEQINDQKNRLSRYRLITMIFIGFIVVSLFLKKILW